LIWRSSVDDDVFAVVEDSFDVFDFLLNFVIV